MLLLLKRRFIFEIFVNCRIYLVTTKCLPTEKRLVSTKSFPTTDRLPIAKRLVINKRLVDENMIEISSSNKFWSINNLSHDL